MTSRHASWEWLGQGHLVQLVSSEIEEGLSGLVGLSAQVLPNWREKC